MLNWVLKGKNVRVSRHESKEHQGRARGRVGAGCDGLNDIYPIHCRLIYLNTQPPVGGAVWGGYGPVRQQSLAIGSIPLQVGWEGL